MKKNKKLVIGIGIVVLLGFVWVGVYNNWSHVSDSNAIHIGAFFPLTGNLANQGRNVANAFLLAGEDVNESYGKKKYVMDLCDTKADPKVAGLIVQQLINSPSKPAMIFSLVSSAVLHIQPMTEKNQIVLFGFVGTDNLFDSSPKLTYRGMPSALQIGVSATHALRDDLKVHDVLILYPNTAYGLGYGKAVERECKANGVRVFGSYAYEENASGYANFIVSVDARKATSIFLTGAGDNLGVMLKVIRESGYEGPILCDLNLTPTIVKNSHASLKNLYMLDYASPRGDRYQVFSKKYAERFGKDPDPLAVICYELFCVYDKAKQELGESVWNDSSAIEGWHYESMLGTINVKNQEIIIPLEVRNVSVK